ncbi:MAG: fumarylacetoacetate hydrolase, partial [Rhizobiales bacterium]|nr:fumarylacetoacetate hydrolase [Hyphomicrobiales bacterium]
MPLDTAAPFALPEDAEAATLVGRVFRPDVDGPSVVALRDGQLIDITASVVTMRDLCEHQDPARVAATADGEFIGSFEEILANTPLASRDPSKPHLIAPIDLQAVKAAGVTFVVSMLERVIEEQARGLPERANAIRAEINATIGDDLAALRPGSEQAAAHMG